MAPVSIIVFLVNDLMYLFVVYCSVCINKFRIVRMHTFKVSNSMMSTMSCIHAFIQVKCVVFSEVTCGLLLNRRNPMYSD